MAQPIELSSASSGGGKESSLSMGLSGYNMKILTMDHSGQHVWKVPDSLHIKDPFCILQKRVDAL